MIINEVREKIQEEAFEKLLESNFNGAILLPTGTGKTNVITRCLKYLNFNSDVIYCCDNKNLRDYDFPAELEKWGLGDCSDYIERKCYKSAYKISGKHYKLAILDEGDYCLTPEYVKFLKNNTFDHIIFVSATLEDEKRKILLQFIPIVYERKLSEIEGKGVINEAEFYFVNYMLTPTENRRYLAYNEAFKKAINGKSPQTTLDAITRSRKLFLMGLDSSAKICRQLTFQMYGDEQNKILIFCGISKQADRVCKFSYHTGNEKDNTVLSDLDEGRIRVASVVGKINRGKNLKGVNTIIFESPSASYTKFVQQSGRGRRLEIDMKLKIFFLIPFYKTRIGMVKPTISQKWVLSSMRNIDLEKVKTFKLG